MVEQAEKEIVSNKDTQAPKGIEEFVQSLLPNSSDNSAQNSGFTQKPTDSGSSSGSSSTLPGLEITAAGKAIDSSKGGGSSGTPADTGRPPFTQGGPADQRPSQSPEFRPTSGGNNSPEFRPTTGGTRPADVARPSDEFTQGSPSDQAVRNQTVPGDRQGLVQLNTGDTFTRVNGRETLVTPNGDTLTLSTAAPGQMRLSAPGAKIEVQDRNGEITRPNQLPGEFGQGETIRVSFQNGTRVTLQGSGPDGGRITSVSRGAASTSFAEAPDRTRK